jgi:hypothetical protein
MINREFRSSATGGPKAALESLLKNVLLLRLLNSDFCIFNSTPVH